METKRGQVVCRLWTVQENHPGKIEGSFCSLHPSMDAMRKFVKAYWSQMPEETPDAYMAPTRPTDLRNRSVLYTCRVDDRAYDRIVKSPDGMWSTTVPPDTLAAVMIIPPKELTSLTEGLLPA